MALADLFFGTDVVNRTGRNNIRGDELATMINAAAPAGLNPFVGQGANVRGAGQNYAQNISAGLDLSTETFYDDLGFFSGGAPTRLTIPVTNPQFTRVMLVGFWQWATPYDVGSFQLSLAKNFNFSQVQQGFSITRYPGIGASDAGVPTIATLSSQPFVVVPGDFFELIGLQNGQANLTLTNGQLSILVLK